MKDITNVAKKFSEFDNHQEVVRIENKALGVAGFVAIHSRRGSFPSLGATRVWSYSSESEALADALRLARLMSHKAVFAGLPYGGAKATLTYKKSSPPNRAELFSWYAEQLNKLEGRFITGSDVGVEEADVSLMRKHSRFVIGDNVPAAYYTALGVYYGIETALEHLYGSGKISDKTFAVQGLGKTGFELVKLLHGKAKKILVADIDREKVRQVTHMFAKTKAVDFSKIHSQAVTMFCPCALHHSINSITEAELRCSAIVGSANSQMENEKVEQQVYRRGILYAVDYAVNNGGLISVVDQYENGKHSDKRIKSKLLATKHALRSVFASSKAEAISPAGVADRYVAKILNRKKIAYHVS